MIGDAPPVALAADQASHLLDRMVHHQVLECVDLDALFRLEQSLALLASELDALDADRAADLARSMVDRALLRLPDDMRQYLRTADWLRCSGCELCADEARDAREAHEARVAFEAGAAGRAISGGGGARTAGRAGEPRSFRRR